MADLIDVRAALASNLTPVTGFQVSPYMLHNPSPPFGHIFPGEVTYDAAMGRGLDYWELLVQVGVSLVSDRGGQVKLDEFMAPSGTTSIKEAIESDPQLGGLVDDLHVTRASGYERFEMESGGTALGATWTVRLLAAGD